MVTVARTANVRARPLGDGN